MGTLHHEIRIDAPVAAVWRVLADIEAVQHYNPTVASARCTSSARGRGGRPPLRPQAEGLGQGAGHCMGGGAVGGPRSRGERMAHRLHALANRPQRRRPRNPRGARPRVPGEFGLLGRLLDSLVMRRKLESGNRGRVRGLEETRRGPCGLGPGSPRAGSRLTRVGRPRGVPRASRPRQPSSSLKPTMMPSGPRM